MSPGAPRVLFVDPMGQRGHLGFNRTYLRRLRELDIRLDVALEPGYAEELGIPPGDVTHALPGGLFRVDAGSLRARVLQLRILGDLTRHLDLRAYDHVLFSSYEEVSFSLARPPGRHWLVNHGANLASLDSPFKRPFLRTAARRASFIVLHEFIRRRCAACGIHDVRVEAHGVPDPHRVDPQVRARTLAAIDPRLAPGRHRHLLFAPATRYPGRFIEALVVDRTFARFLDEREAVLVVRQGHPAAASPNVVILPRWLTDVEYQSLLLASACVLLHYPTDFGYRVSALLFECFANDRPCVVSDIEAFRAFTPHFAYDALYGDIGGLMRAIDAVLHRAWSPSPSPFRDVNALRTPSLAFLETPRPRAGASS